MSIPKAPIRNGKPFHINNALYADKLLSQEEDKGTVTADDARLIRSYIKERTAQRSLSSDRQNKIILFPAAWRRFLIGIARGLGSHISSKTVRTPSILENFQNIMRKLMRFCLFVQDLNQIVQSLYFRFQRPKFFFDSIFHNYSPRLSGSDS
jgi:hypothetical protein